MRTFFTTTYFIKVAMLSILLSLSYLSNAQTVVIPENVRRKCADAPLQDKVEIFEKECAREAYTVNGWGVKYNRRCIEWRNIPTNLYARRELNNAVELVASRDHQNAIGLFWQGVASGSFHHFNAQEIAISSLKEEITTLLQINDCNSKALRRFEENLIRFAQGRTSLKIEGFAE